jgi:hypothetical protein
MLLADRFQTPGAIPVTIAPAQVTQDTRRAEAGRHGFTCSSNDFIIRFNAGANALPTSRFILLIARRIFHRENR